MEALRKRLAAKIEEMLVKSALDAWQRRMSEWLPPPPLDGETIALWSTSEWERKMLSKVASEVQNDKRNGVVVRKERRRL